MVQFGLYISPVGFSSNIVPENAGGLLYSTNPMVGVIDGFRWAILGGDTPLYWPGFLLSLSLVLADPRQRHPVFPHDGKDLCGRDLTMAPVISVENLSKKYIIGHQRQERGVCAYE